MLTKLDDVQGELVGFYKNLLGTAALALLQTMRVGPRLSHEAGSMLIQTIIVNEIDSALKNINDAKAPGIDGFNSFFFKKSWHVMYDDVYGAVQEFFKKAILHKPFNATTITLMPKVDNAVKARNFRPIACCTAIYKIISNIITKTLQGVINEIVADSQTGFMPDRHISDNILLVTELIRGYTRKGMSPRCYLKVDIKKAYDSVEWPFLGNMLEDLGFLVSSRHG